MNKIDIEPGWWDENFAPSSCLVLITTRDDEGQANAVAFGTCTRVCHDPRRRTLRRPESLSQRRALEQQMLARVSVCGLRFRPGLNELDKAGLTEIPGRVLSTPRIAESRSHFDAALPEALAGLNSAPAGVVARRVETGSVDAAQVKMA